MFQVALVPHQHDHDVLVGVIFELLEPSCDVLVRCVFGDVIH